MIKGKTSLTVFMELTESKGRLPDKDEFMKMGYDKSTYYRAKKQFHHWLVEEDNLDGFICGIHHCDGDCASCHGGRNCYKNTMKDLGVIANEQKKEK